VVPNFPEVFSNDIHDVLPEREVKFSIYVAPGTRPIFMASYRMSAIELNEMNEQLKELLAKRFI
jgi:hypothetical protein